MMSVANGDGQAHPDDEPRTLRGTSGRSGRWPFWPAVTVVLVGLAASGVLAWVSYESYTHNENRLLHLRARDVGTVLTSALPSIQTPLASATALADATRGDMRKFTRLISPYVGHGPTRPFVSASLWRVNAPGRGPLAVIGTRPALATAPLLAQSFFARASAAPNLSVLDLLGRGRLGYTFTAAHGPFAAYAESALPRSRYQPVQKNSAFADLDYALYLGRSTRPTDLLIASVRRLPLSGRQTTVRVPFGGAFFTITVAARGPLSGSLPQRLPWAIALVGTLLTLAAGGLTVRLIQGRRRVERLADQIEETAEENRRLYAEQRGIAQTLQHALLPDLLPQLPGLQVGARYEAGAEGVDIGGDWYDLIALGERRLLLVVGDVSGRGLRAATTMALLRFAIHAYAAQGDDPPTFLPKLSRLVNVTSDRQLATVVCASIDVSSREMSITNAGHLPPLMISTQGAEFLESDVGLPVGVDHEATYSSTRMSAPPRATLLAFTDGLVERRGESIEVGLERLRSHVVSNHVSLDQLLGRVLSEMREDPSDDAAIAAIRWTN